MTDDATSFPIGRARQGDAESCRWLVTRLSPLLKLQASYCMPKELRRLYDPEVLVNDTRLAVLPQLRSFQANDGGWTAVLLKYLSTAALWRVNGLVSETTMITDLRS